MKKGTRWVGLDVHAETIAVAIAGDTVVQWVGSSNLDNLVADDTPPDDRAALDETMRRLIAFWPPRNEPRFKTAGLNALARRSALIR